MKYLISICTFFLFILSSALMIAQTDIISAKDFMTLMKSGEDLVIIDANKAKNYDANHIKGAVNIYHMDLYKEGDIAGVIKSPEELAYIFGNSGISEKTKVVIYDDGSQKYSSRLYWTLKYLGAESVQTLHKDLTAWRAARIPLTAAKAKVNATTFTPSVNNNLYINKDEVLARKDQDGVVLIDCRTADEFNGVKRSEGHIPGAVNMNYEELLTDNGAFKSPAELKTISEKYGITPDSELILYCRTSVRATVAYIAFKNILKYNKVKVYDGAYLEWVATHPVVQ